MQKTVNYNNTDHILETQKKTKAYKNAKQWMALLHWAFQKNPNSYTSMKKNGVEIITIVIMKIL